MSGTDRESPTSPAPPPDAELVSALDDFEAALQRHGFTAQGTKAGAALEDARRELEPAGEYTCAACDGHIVIVAGDPLVACADCIVRAKVGAPRPVDAAIAYLDGQVEERRQIIEWLRSGDGIGGDDSVARTIADALLYSEHVLWKHAVENRSIPDQENAPPAPAESKLVADEKTAPLLDQCRALAWINGEYACDCSLAKGHRGAHQIIVRASEWREP